MIDAQLEILQTLLDWLKQQQPVWLASVTATYGSSPRPVGSLMAWSPQYGRIGSLSGGCVEQSLLAQLANMPRTPTVVRQRYGIDKDERQRYRLPCGGHLDILLEALDHNALPHLTELVSKLQKRQPCVRQVKPDGSLALTTDQGQQTGFQGQTWQQLFKPDYRLLISGATDVALELAQLARPAGFDVHICDFRDEFLHGFDSPYANVRRAMPDQLVAQYFNDEYSAVVALAHDPKVDDLAVWEALNSQAFYVGAMGSKQTSQARRQRLLELGVNEQQLQRLHAPVGLPIASTTPYQIAISIIAHLLQQRPQVS